MKSKLENLRKFKMKPSMLKGIFGGVGCDTVADFEDSFDVCKGELRLTGEPLTQCLDAQCWVRSESDQLKA